MKNPTHDTTEREMATVINLVSPFAVTIHFETSVLANISQLFTPISVLSQSR